MSASGLKHVKTQGTAMQHTYHISIYRFYMFLLIVHDCSFFSNHTLNTDSLFQPHVNLYIIYI